MGQLAFISYKREDEEQVKVLSQDIDSIDGFESWYDAKLSGGQKWWHQILNQIRLCDVFVFALSQASMSSKPCMVELQYAFDLCKAILPVKIAGKVKYEDLPKILKEIQITGYSSATKEEFQKLSNELINIPSNPLPVPLPIPPSIPDGSKSYVMVDNGARKKITLEYKNLLPVGVIKVEGVFQKGELIEVVGLDEKVVGFGPANFSSEELRLVMGKPSSRCGEIFGDYQRSHCVMRREFFDCGQGDN